MPLQVMGLHLKRKLVKWGNGYGIRLTKAEFERLGVGEGAEVEADVSAVSAAPPASWPSWHLGGARLHKEEALVKDWEEQRARRRQ